MVFCNTLNSSRAVDHFLTENQISTVNYHGEVPAEERFVIFFTLLPFMYVLYDI
jgi:superfamily II DNA/RNA helicase